MTSKQIRIEMFVPKKAVGAIIGRQGVVIKQVGEEGCMYTSGSHASQHFNLQHVAFQVNVNGGRVFL